MEKEQFDVLLATAKDELVTTPKATKEDKNAVEASNPQLVNELLAERLALVEQIKFLTARKGEIEDVVKDIIGSKDVLLVHGAKVASIARWRETAVETAVVKEMFSITEYPELFKRSSKSRLTIH